MKYVLVDGSNEIVSTADLASNVGLSGAKTYFKGVKRLEEKEFDKLWKVMSEVEHIRIKVNDETHREYEEFGSWLDIEKS